MSKSSDEESWDEEGEESDNATSCSSEREKFPKVDITENTHLLFRAEAGDDGDLMEPTVITPENGPYYELKQLKVIHLMSFINNTQAMVGGWVQMKQVDGFMVIFHENGQYLRKDEGVMSHNRPFMLFAINNVDRFRSDVQWMEPLIGPVVFVPVSSIEREE